jgi:hypothetical protein
VLQLFLGVNNVSGLDEAEVGEGFLEVGVALALNLPLVGLLSVFRIDLVDNIHTFDNLGKGRKTHAIEVAVVVEVDEELGGTGIFARGSKHEGASLVALNDRVVFDGLGPPLRSDLGIRVNPELGDEVGHYSEKTDTVEEGSVQHLFEAGGADRGPLRKHLQNDVTGGLLVQLDVELDFVAVVGQTSHGNNEKQAKKFHGLNKIS